jgi:hypothetical protein
MAKKHDSVFCIFEIQHWVDNDTMPFKAHTLPLDDQRKWLQEPAESVPEDIRTLYSEVAEGYHDTIQELTRALERDKRSQSDPTPTESFHNTMSSIDEEDPRIFASPSTMSSTGTMRSLSFGTIHVGLDESLAESAVDLLTKPLPEAPLSLRGESNLGTQADQHFVETEYSGNEEKGTCRAGADKAANQLAYQRLSMLSLPPKASTTPSTSPTEIQQQLSSKSDPGQGRATKRWRDHRLKLQTLTEMVRRNGSLKEKVEPPKVPQDVPTKAARLLGLKSVHRKEPLPPE